MEKIRKKMDEIKDAIVVADASTDEFREKKAAALKTLTEHQLRFEDVRRHKKSLEHRLVVVTKQLKSCSDRLAKCEMHDENETKALEAIESKGELHDVRIDTIQQKITAARMKSEEDQASLEDGRRRIKVLKQEIQNMQDKIKKKESKIENMEKMLKKDNKLSYAVENDNTETLTKEDALEDQIDSLREKITSNKERIHVAERELPSLEYKIKTAKREIADTKKRTATMKDEIKKGLDAVFKDID
eukprot:Seg1704.4 transcript_id=Seg1704.4/GoldUCD/mRNA.D3Y31 product="hypothetical protein" protein_id=Seg1704.4/GoldUCD/D3Y31